MKNDLLYTYKIKTGNYRSRKQTRTRISKPTHFVVKLDFKKLEGSDKKSFLVVPVGTLTKYLPMIQASVKMLRIVFVLDKKQDGVQK